MKIMKKLLAVALMLVLVLGVMAGCSSGNDEKTNDDGTQQKETLVMATNAQFPPYEYYDGDKIVGIDAEVAALIAEKLGMELEIADIEFDSIVPGVQQGKYDMGMAGMTVNDERLEQVNFTTSFLPS